MDMTDTELAQILWDYNKFESPLEKADIILGLGNSDIETAKHSAKLFLDGMAPIILFTGQFGLLTKDNFAKTEAEVFADEAVKMGVPKDKILLEKEATNTGENITFSKALLEKKGIQPKKFIVVAKPHQLRRAYATFMKVWPGQNLIMNTIDCTYERYFKRHKNQFIDSLVAVTQRVIIYPEKGFQIEQPMPDEVKDAYEELIKRGYDKQLVT